MVLSKPNTDKIMHKKRLAFFFFFPFFSLIYNIFLVAQPSYSLISSLYLIVREYLLYLLSVLLDTTFLHLISGNVWPILTSGGHVTKCTFLCAPQKEHRQALEILFLSFSGVDFKPVAGIRKLSKVRKCHPTLQKTSSIFSMWRLGFFFSLQCMLCLLLVFAQ